MNGKVTSICALLLLFAACSHVTDPSKDAGWRPFGSGLPETTTVKALTSDASGTLCLAGTVDGVFILDSGGVWRPANNGLEARDISCLAVHPHNSSIFFAGTWGKGVWRSADGGASWKYVWKSEMNPLINHLAVAANGLVWVATEHGLYVSSDQGSSWQAAYAYGKIYTAAVHPLNPQLIVFGARWRGSFASTDQGRTWVSINEGVYRNDQEIAAGQSFYFFNDQTDHWLMSTDYTGLYETFDAGKTWRLKAADAFSEALVEIAGTYDGKQLWAITKSGSVYACRDGRSWSLSNTGLGDAKAKSLYVLPTTKNAALIGTVGKGVFQWTD